MSTPIWDAVINGLHEMAQFNLTPYAIVLTDEQWLALRAEWRFGFSYGRVEPHQRRINGVCVAIADDDYKGPVVLGHPRKEVTG